jgi:hypothetical protein
MSFSPSLGNSDTHYISNTTDLLTVSAHIGTDSLLLPFNSKIETVDSLYAQKAGEYKSSNTCGKVVRKVHHAPYGVMKIIFVEY